MIWICEHVWLNAQMNNLECTNIIYSSYKIGYRIGLYVRVWSTCFGEERASGPWRRPWHSKCRCRTCIRAGGELGNLPVRIYVWCRHRKSFGCGSWAGGCSRCRRPIVVLVHRRVLATSSFCRYWSQSSRNRAATTRTPPPSVMDSWASSPHLHLSNTETQKRR